MKIFLCGDVMTGRGIDQIQRHSVPPQIYEGYVKDARDYVTLAEEASGPITRQVPGEYIWGEALNIWREKNPDVKIINLETALTTSETPMRGKGINYRMHPENISVLTSAGIDVCSLANNHILDWEIAGLKDTLSTLKRAQIKYAGAGENLKAAQAPAIIETTQGRVLVFSFCLESSGVPSGWGAEVERPGVWLLSDMDRLSTQEVREVIESYQEEGDVIIASVHWGGNWGYEISEKEKNFAHGLIDVASVDILHGHSSHHPRPFEIYHGRPIFYGCGDFINDYEGIHGYEEYRGDLTLMYFIDCETKPFKYLSLDLECLQIRQMKLHAATSTDSKWMLERLGEVNKLI